MTIPDEENAEKLLPRFICQQLLEALMTEEAPSRVIHRLTDAYRIASDVSRERILPHTPLGESG